MYFISKESHIKNYLNIHNYKVTFAKKKLGAILVDCIEDLYKDMYHISH